MKKIFIVSLFLIVNAYLYSQKAEVVSAFNYNKFGELDKAKESIEKALNDPTTATWEKTWYYRGVIYHSIYESVYIKKDPKFKSLADEPLVEAYKSYQKTLELDVKKQFYSEVVSRLKIAANAFAVDGVNKFNEKNYTKSLEYFEYSLEINSLPQIMKLDTLIIYNAALAADKAGNYNKAKQYYSKAAELKYMGGKCYLLLAGVFFQEKDTTSGIEVLKKGIEMVPNDNQDLMNQLIDMYLKQRKSKEALEYLDKAIQKDPKKTIYYFAKGNIYDGLKEYDKAEEVYKKAIEIDPNYIDGLFNLGILNYNRGVEEFNFANEEKDPKKITELQEKAKERFKSAIPYLEKALELSPNDRDIINSLKTVYYRVGDMEKHNQMKAKLEGKK